MNRLTLGSSLVVVLVFAAGCTPKPRVNIGFIDARTGPVAGQTDSYAFPRTFVEIKPVKTDVIVEAVARNQTHEDFRVGIGRRKQWGVKTFVAITKVQNSDMLDEVGVETKDERIATIEALGKVVTGVMPFVGLASQNDCPAASQNPPTLVKAQLFDSLRLLQLCNISTVASGSPDQNAGWRHLMGMNVWFGPTPPDAQPVNTSAGYTPLVGPSFESGIVYAACREIRLKLIANQTVTVAGQAGQKSTETQTPVEVYRSIYVSDPRYFRVVALPYKGKVKLHPQCGTSTTTDNTAAPASELAIAAALLAQAEAIKKAAEKDDEK